MKYSLELIGADALVHKIHKISDLRMEAIIKKQVVQMLNKARNGYTPIDTGELRQSSASNGVDTMYYTKSYAPHVEYGHRVVRNGKQIGYAQGQHYLRRNIENQEPIFLEDVRKQLKRYL